MATELLDDELTFLRGVEQDVQRIYGFAHSRAMPGNGPAELLVSLKRKLNERVIELLEERDHANQ